MAASVSEQTMTLSLIIELPDEWTLNQAAILGKRLKDQELPTECEVSVRDSEDAGRDTPLDEL